MAHVFIDHLLISQIVATIHYAAFAFIPGSRRRDSRESHLPEVHHIGEARQSKTDQKLQKILNSLPVLISYVDHNWTYRFNNDAYVRWFGRTAAEIYGKKISEIVNPKTFEVVKPYIARALEGEAVSFEFQVLSRRSPIQFAHANYAPDFRADGSVAGFYSVVTDLTELREQEIALRESEERFKLAERGSLLGVWDWFIQTNKLYLSPIWKEILGYTDDELPSQLNEWERRIHPDDREKTQRILDETFAGSCDQYENEHRLLHKNGQYRWILSRGFLVRDAEGKPYRMSGSHVDITDRKLIEERMKFHAEVERAVINISNRLLHLSAKDVDLGITEALKDLGKVMKVDKVFVFLYSSDGLTADNTHEWTGEGIPSRLAELKSLPAQEFVYALSHFNRKAALYVKDVNKLPPEASAERYLMEQVGAFSMLAVPMFFRESLLGCLGFESSYRTLVYSDEMVNVLRIAGEIFVNALQRSAAERALIQQTESLVRTNSDLEQFAYISSHDLQEPLRTMSIYLELLERRSGEKLDSEAKEFLRTAVTSAGHMRELIHDILAYSRSGRKELRKDVVNHADVLKIVLDNLKQQILESDALITFRNLPCLRGDRFQLVQLFQNLISNSIKYRRDVHPEISISAEEFDTHWEFQVRDNGLGIEKRYFDRIFQIFERLHVREKYSGTGIGLALAKKIVERHGGSIWLESEVGQGTTFYFTLPK